MPDTDVLAARWAARHPGFQVGSGVLAGWLRVMWWLARPLARLHVPPDVVTVSGAAAAVAATRAAPGAASTLLLVSTLADGLDGAVAVLADVHTRHGTALDHTADRVGDLCAVAVLGRAGASPRVVAPAAALSLLVELGRSRRAPVLTVNERPTRLVCAVLGDLGARVTGRPWPAVVSAVVWDVLAVTGAVQVLRSPRRAR